jgi:hypothetical protein
MLILAANLLNRNDGRCLLVHNSAKAGLALDDNVRNAHLATERRNENHKLHRVNVMRNDNKRSLLCFDQRNNVIEAVFRVK